MKRLCRSLVICVAVMMFVAADTPVLDTSFKTYPLRTSDAQIVVDAIKELIGDKGRVFYLKTSKEMIISTTSNLHSQVSMLLKEVDKAPRNVMIVITTRTAGNATSSGVGLKNPGAKVVIGPNGRKAHLQASPYVKMQSSRESSLNSQKLMVRSGGEASFFVGQDVPFLKWLTQAGVEWGDTRGVVPRLEEPEIEWRSVGASLWIKPTVIGNGPLVSVRVVPELSGLIQDPEERLDRRMRRIRYSRVATEVTVQHGQSVSLGGLVKNKEFYSRFLVGVDANGNRQSMDISLTPYILDEKGKK